MTSVPSATLACICMTLSVTAACGTIQRQQPSGGIAKPVLAMSSPGRASDVISSIDLASVGAGSAYEALARLRPELVRGTPSMRGPGSDRPVLYVDGVREGHIELLANIRAALIADMSYYRPSEARTRFGPRDGAGVLVVRTRR